MKLRRGLQLALRLPGPPTCSFCGADDAELVLAGAEAFICAECIRDTTSESDPTPRRTTCSLCGSAFGAPAGLLQRGRRAPALARGGEVACQRCLTTARRILRRLAAPGDR